MRLYQSQHQFYCGIDLHANAMYACVAGADGKKCLHQNFQVRNTESFLEPIQALSPSPVVAMRTTGEGERELPKLS
jgi:hypothetical protein